MPMWCGLRGYTGYREGTDLAYEWYPRKSLIYKRNIEKGTEGIYILVLTVRISYISIYTLVKFSKIGPLGTLLFFSLINQ